MGKRQGPKKAFVAYPVTDVKPKTLKVEDKKEFVRPTLPDFPLFCEPGPIHHWFDACKIMGKDAFGGTCTIADIRGWGYLTGKGQALALDSDTAVEAQQKAADFIVDAVNEKLVREGYISGTT